MAGAHADGTETQDASNSMPSCLNWYALLDGAGEQEVRGPAFHMTLALDDLEVIADALRGCQHIGFEGAALLGGHPHPLHPGSEGMRFALNLVMGDMQAGAVEECAPLSGGVLADMAGVAALVPVVDRRVEVGVCGRDVVNQDEAAAGDQHACHLRDGGTDVGVVVRGDAHRDEIKSFVEEGQPLRVGNHEGDVALAARLDEAARGGEHERREVAGDDAGDMRRDGQRSMTATGGDIQRGITGARRGKLLQPRQIVTRRVRGAGHIAFGGAAKLLADALLDVLAGVLAAGGWVQETQELQAVAEGIASLEALTAGKLDIYGDGCAGSFEAAADGVQVADAE